MAETLDFFSARLARAPVLAVLRGQDPRGSVAMAEACWDAGLELVEVSIAGDRDLERVRAVCERASALGRLAGAGTVCTEAELRAVALVDAAFAVAPGLSHETVGAARQLSMPYLPGVVTPSEVQAALALGCRTLKLFPAGELTPAWIRALAGPFPDARLVAVGGITAANAEEFVDAGAIGVAIGSGLDPASLRPLLGQLRNAAAHGREPTHRR